MHFLIAQLVSLSLKFLLALLWKLFLSSWNQWSVLWVIRKYKLNAYVFIVTAWYGLKPPGLRFVAQIASSDAPRAGSRVWGSAWQRTAQLQSLWGECWLRQIRLEQVFASCWLTRLAGAADLSGTPALWSWELFRCVDTPLGINLMYGLPGSQ